MKIVIAGAGEVGTHLSKELSLENHDITILDIDAEKVSQIDSTIDVLAVTASATSIKSLKENQIDEADLFLAVTSVEAVNINSAILAKKLGAKRTIARVAHAEFVTEENLAFFNSLGIDNLIYPEELVAAEITQLIKSAAATDVVEFEGGKLTLLGIRVDRTAPIYNKTMIEISKEYQSNNFRIVVIKRNFRTIIPSGNDRIVFGDQLFILTTASGIKQILEMTGKENTKLQNVMILGGGRIGRKVAKNLEKEINIKMIEFNQNKTEELADYLQNTLVIQGDGRNIDLLAQEGIIDMDGFIAVTEDAETNIITCLMAKHLGAKKTIAQVDNVDYIPLSNTIGLDSLVNKKLIAANTISRYIRKANIISTFSISGIDAVIIEFVVREKSAVTKSEIKDVHFPKGTLIGGTVKNDEGFIIVGNTVLEAGDKVLVFTLPENVHKIEKLF